MGPRAGLDRCGKSRLHLDLIPGPIIGFCCYIYIYILLYYIILYYMLYYYCSITWKWAILSLCHCCIQWSAMIERAIRRIERLEDFVKN